MAFITMKIHFCLDWIQSQSSAAKGFKSKPAGVLFSEFVQRISRFSVCSAVGTMERKSQKSGAKIWICDRGPKSSMPSSEQLAAELQRCLNSSIRELKVVIGGPDGFSNVELEALQPDLRWSFGPLTFPHELAAVIAAEQIYRAWTILKQLPYHSGH